MDILVRELRASDFRNGFLELVNNSSKRALSFRRALWIAKRRKQCGIHTYVAIVRDKVVGTASLLIEQKFIHRGAIAGRVEDVAVRCDRQRNGIGQKLISYLNREARKFGCYKITLSCRDGLITFYELCGYEKRDEGMRVTLRTPSF